MLSDDLTNDFSRFIKLPAPVKRAAYSDRTAWLMAIMSELAYTKFDEEDDATLATLATQLATELASLSDESPPVDKIKLIRKVLLNNTEGENKVLRAILEAGGLKLKGIVYDPGTDTQGFVAYREPDEDGLGFAIIAFRGTQQIKDWLSNVDANKVPIKSPRAQQDRELGKVHRGFHNAYQSVHPQILKHLEGLEALPIYITGHSLGGALATLATWYLSGDKLAACYTFGAPRVGDKGLSDLFHTPIYRINNGADPVPFVPASDIFVDGIKFLVRTIGIVITPVNRLLPIVINWQGFQHYGSQRYLSICEPGEDGTYPKLRNEYGVSSLERIWRYVNRMLAGEFSFEKRIDKYHYMDQYRAKLREYAIRRNHQKL